MQRKNEGIHSKIKFASHIFNKQAKTLRTIPQDPVDNVFH